MAPLCFHSRPKCEFCRFPPRPGRHRERCAACGRYRKAGPPECERCRSRGFRALRLPWGRTAA